MDVSCPEAYWSQIPRIHITNYLTEGYITSESFVDNSDLFLANSYV